MIDLKALEQSIQRTLYKEDKASLRKWFKKHSQGRFVYRKDKFYKAISRLKRKYKIKSTHNSITKLK